MFSNNDIARYYDVSEVHYKQLWDLDRSRSLHYGYWDATTKNFHEALLNINKVLSRHANIQATDKVLDAGCGIGGSSVWLGKNIGCSVTGISLSAKQVATANTIAQKEKVDHAVKFEQQDFTATTYAAETFDVIWAIESVCHAADKSRFLKEAFRVLKKGGRLIMADFFKKENLTGNDAALIQRWANGWAIDDFATIEKFEEQLIAAGFTSHTIENATAAIHRSAKRLYISYFPGAVGGFLYRLFHRKATEFGKKNIDTAYLQYKCLQKGLWQYQIISAVK
jgi:tocopherol O-methyltransferase